MKIISDETAKELMVDGRLETKDYLASGVEDHKKDGIGRLVKLMEKTNSILTEMANKESDEIDLSPIIQQQNIIIESVVLLIKELAMDKKKKTNVVFTVQRDQQGRIASITAKGE